MIGHLHTTKERTREHDETQTDDAAGEMRKLEDRERQELAQHGETGINTRRCARDEQNEACEKGEGAGDLRHDRCDVQGGERVGARERPAPRCQLLHAK